MEDHIKSLIEKAAMENTPPDAAMKLAQAALNAANAMVAISKRDVTDVRKYKLVISAGKLNWIDNPNVKQITFDDMADFPEAMLSAIQYVESQVADTVLGKVASFELLRSA